MNGELFNFPLALAASSGNTHMLQLLITHGADVALTDSHGNNILHSLIILFIRCPKAACAMYTCLMENITKDGVLQKLHEAYNNNGLTALELAAEHCTPEMLQLILCTDQVYRFHISRQGVYINYQYKIPLRGGNTFLHRISKATKTDMSRLSGTSFFFKEPVKSLITELDRKYKNNVYLSMSGAMLLFILYQVYLYVYLSTQATPPKVFTVILFSFLSLWFIIETISNSREVVHFRENIKRLRIGKQSYLMNAVFFLPTMCFWVLLFILCLVDLINKGNSTLSVPLHSAAALCSCFSFMSFLRLSPTFSHLFVMLLKMFEETAKFAFLALFIQCGFAVFFYVLSVAPKVQSNGMLQNETVNLQDKFSTIMYDTFLLSFAGRLPDDFADSPIPNLSLVFYILCFVSNAVVLLNLLIAVFSYQIEDVYRFKHAIRFIIKVGMALYLRNVAMIWQSIFAKVRRKNAPTSLKDLFIFETIEKKPSS